MDEQDPNPLACLLPLHLGEELDDYKMEPWRTRSVRHESGLDKGVNDLSVIRTSAIPSSCCASSGMVGRGHPWMISRTALR
jgi:hypothetical protein